jgi:hypothetical protein
MSGHAHRRHSTRLVLAAALACALAWVGMAAAAEIGPVARAVHASAEIVVAQPLAQHVTQRATARLGHVRSATVGATHRNLTGTAASGILVIVLAMLFSLALARRNAPPRVAVRLPGVRAPPAAARDRSAA